MIHRALVFLAVLVPATFAYAEVSGHSLQIIDRPISFNEERENLTIRYRQIHQDPQASTTSIVPRIVVLHYTGGRSADATWRYFNKTRLSTTRRKLTKGGALNVSAHFLVDRDGTVYRLMPETTMARHCIGLNHLALGIENVGNGTDYPLTRAQLESNVALLKHLKALYPTIEYLIGHSEYRRFEGSRLFVERDSSYRNRKGDPGTKFLTEVRRGLTGLGLLGPPAVGGQGER
jgi:N-acetyl-anhydromuramyl-L-alanine amidase AmpD